MSPQTETLSPAHPRYQLSLSFKGSCGYLLNADGPHSLTEAQVKRLAAGSVAKSFYLYTLGLTQAETVATQNALPQEVQKLSQRYGFLCDNEARMKAYRVEEHRGEAGYAGALLVSLEMPQPTALAFLAELSAQRQRGVAPETPAASFEFRENFDTAEVELYVRGQLVFSSKEYRTTARYAQTHYQLSNTELLEMYKRYKEQVEA